MNRDVVTVQASTAVVDTEGIVTQAWADIAQVEGVMLPYGNERALREYGFAENVQYRFFYKGTHPALVVGNRMLHRGLALHIVYVADYSKAMDVLLTTSGIVGKHSG